MATDVWPDLLAWGSFGFRQFVHKYNDDTRMGHQVDQLRRECGRFSYVALLHHSSGPMTRVFFRVPLDYFNANSGNASLSVIRYLATNKTANFGTLFTNPGGPGGSGVQFVSRVGKQLSDVVNGRYDIVSTFSF